MAKYPRDIKQSGRAHENRCTFWSEVQWKVALLPMTYNPACTSHHKWTRQSLPGIPSNLAPTWPLEQRNSGLFQSDPPDTRLKYLAEQSWDPPSFSFGHPLWDLEWALSSLHFSSPLRTTALSHLNRRLCPNSVTLRRHSGSVVIASSHPSQLWDTYLVKISLLFLCSGTAMPSQMPHRSAEAHGAPKESGGQCQASVQGHRPQKVGVPVWQRHPQNDSTSPNCIFPACKMCISLSSPCDGNPPCSSQGTTKETPEAANTKKTLS